MYRRVLALATLVLAQIQGPGSLAQPMAGSSGGTAPSQAITCTITQLDTVTTSFVCGTGSDTHTYWVKRATRFVSGQPNASFFALASGQAVAITSHRDGGFEIADVVRY